MARIRSIKPDFFLNDDLADLPPLTRLFLIGLWTQADREGRLQDRPKRLKPQLVPYDDCDVDAMLSDLERLGFIVRYQVEGQALIQVVNFLKHQAPHYKEVPSVLPEPTSGQRQTDVEPTSGQPCLQEGKGREGIGKGEDDAPKSIPSNFPKCFDGEVERNGTVLSFRGHLLRDLEQYAGTWPGIPKNQGKLGAAICDGCPPDCDGSTVRRCASALIKHARTLNAEFTEKGETFPVELFLYKAREGAR